MMRILMIGPSLTLKGGISTVLRNYYNEKKLFNKLGIDIDFFASINSKDRFNQIIIFPFKLLLLLSKVNKYDVVHIHVASKGSFLRKNIISRICKKQKIPYIIHLHGAEFHQFYQGEPPQKQEKIRSFFEGSEKIIVLGESWKEFVGSLILDNKKIVVLNNAVPQIDCKTNKKNINEHIVLGFLGEIGHRKGIYDLVACVDSFSTDVNILVKIAGNGEIDKLENTISNSKNSFRFNLVGWVDRVKRNEFLNDINILVLPSYNEGLPMSILEAMSYGKPIVSTDVGSISEAIINKRNGFIISPGDKQQLFDAINTFILNPSLIEEMGTESKKIFEEKFLLDNHIRKLAKLYEVAGR